MNLADILEDVGAQALTMYRGWAWACVNLGRRIESRPWKPKDRFRGCLMAVHAGQLLGYPSQDPLRPRGTRYVGVRELAELTRMAIRAGFEARYDPIRRHVLVETPDRELVLDPETTPAGAIVGFCRLDGWQINPRDRDLPAWRRMPEEIRQGRGWARPGWWGFQMAEFIPLPQPVPCTGWTMLWTIPRATLEEIDKITQRDHLLRDRLAELAGTCRRPIYPMPVIEAPADWSKARIFITRPRRLFGRCEFCEDPIGPGQRYAHLHRKRVRRAHYECAPGLGRPVGDTGGRHGKGNSVPPLRLIRFRGVR